MLDFLWRLMSCVSLYSAIGYQGEVKRAPSEDAVLPLDPIDVACSAKLQRIRSIAIALDCKFCLQALKWLDDPSELWLDGPPAKMNDHKPTANKYSAHLSEMADRYRITERLNGPSSLAFVSGYFAVPKSPTHSRSIFSGRSLSRLFVTPPPVNIPAVEDIFALLTWLIPLRKTWFTFTGDIRHWFHQIKIGPGLARYMGLHGPDNTYYRYRVLPMGWSFSPRICQSLAWAILLSAPANPDRTTSSVLNSDGLAKARRQCRQIEHPPKYVLLHDDAGNVVGFVTLTYDNIGIWCSDEKIWLALVAKINAAMRWCNVVIKEAHPVTHEQMLVDGPHFTGMSHLGIQYGLKESSGVLYPTWRLDPERIERYVETLDLLETKIEESDSGAALSRREVARVVGIVIWHLTVIQRPLCYATTLIAVLRGVSTGARRALTRKDWDVVAPLSEAHLKYLSTMLSEVIRNDWHDAKIQSARTGEYSLFTDASNECMGAVFCLPDGQVFPESTPFHPRIHEVHIFLKEVTALVWFTVKYIRVFKLKNAHLNVVTDNSAAYFAFTHLYSSNQFANRWIRYFHSELTAAGCSWSIYLVISEDNPADLPSRFRSVICPKRLAAGFRSVNAMKKGQLLSSCPAKPWLRELHSTSVLRHVEGTTIDLEGQAEEIDDIAVRSAQFVDQHEMMWQAPTDVEMCAWFGIRKRPRTDLEAGSGRGGLRTVSSDPTNCQD